MPTVALQANVLFKALGREYTEEEFDELCFEFGLELDEVTSEKEMFRREQGDEKTKDLEKELSEETIFKIDVPANRYDLLCIEGLVRGLMVFQGRMPVPEYRKVEPPDGRRVSIMMTQECVKVRPFVVAAVLRNVTFNRDRYNSFIDLQDKLHHNICRKRTLVAIGTHDLDRVHQPVVYDAKRPCDIRFKALNQAEERSAEELMEMYAKDNHLKHYLHIIKDKPLYPIIYDQRGIVLSMPPIINSEYTKICLDTKNVLIECTATDLTKAKIVLDTMTTMFSEYCAEPFTVEPVQVIASDGRTVNYPDLTYREELIPVKQILSGVGIEATPQRLTELLSRMCLVSKVEPDGEHLRVRIPPTRHDVIHSCDIVEDVAVAYGYDNVPQRTPATHCVASQFAINKLTDKLRQEMAATGFTECLTFSLCSRDDVSTKLRRKIEDVPAVHIANPKTIEFQVARTTLLPGVLRTISCNRQMPLPMKLFEIQDVVLKDENMDVGARNRRHLCALYYGKQSGFEVLHGLLDRLMQLLNVPAGDGENSYTIRSAEDPTYFSGRCADIIYNNASVGKVGILHPEVIQNFDLNLPSSAIEIDLENFL